MIPILLLSWGSWTLVLGSVVKFPAIALHQLFSSFPRLKQMFKRKIISFCLTVCILLVLKVLFMRNFFVQVIFLVPLFFSPAAEVWVAAKTSPEATLCQTFLPNTFIFLFPSEAHVIASQSSGEITATGWLQPGITGRWDGPATQQGANPLVFLSTLH